MRSYLNVFSRTPRPNEFRGGLNGYHARVVHVLDHNGKCTFYFYVRTKPDRSSNSVLVIGFIVVFEFLMRCVTNLLLRFEREGCNERKREREGRNIFSPENPDQEECYGLHSFGSFSVTNRIWLLL